MFSRNRLDIGWFDLCSSLWACLFGQWSPTRQSELNTMWHPDGAVFSTVRAAWDAVLTQLNLPAGSEVLCSAVNIPDMFQLMEHHGLVAIPLELDSDTLSVEGSDWKEHIHENTRLILVTHLLGTRNNLDTLFSAAAAHGVPVIEDCAQAFVDHHYWGDERALASLFSFGPIKTRSALGGAIAIIRDWYPWTMFIGLPFCLIWAYCAWLHTERQLKWKPSSPLISALPFLSSFWSSRSCDSGSRWFRSRKSS